MDAVLPRVQQDLYLGLRQVFEAAARADAGVDHFGHIDDGFQNVRCP